LDLPPPQQAIQAAHACIEVARYLLAPSDEHPHLVLFGIPSEKRLLHILRRLQSLGIECKPFRDSDFGDELTALATEPVRCARRRFFRKYQCLQPKAVGA
jgi:hypothetical protein